MKTEFLQYFETPLLYRAMWILFCFCYTIAEILETKIFTCSFQCPYIKYTLCFIQGMSWPWSYGRWIYNYLCNQCLSPLMLWVWVTIRAKCTTFDSDRSVVFSTSSAFLHQQNWPSQYNWNNVESGVKNHQTNNILSIYTNSLYINIYIYILFTS
jgi:hypothetical protein